MALAIRALFALRLATIHSSIFLRLRANTAALLTANDWFMSVVSPLSPSLLLWSGRKKRWLRLSISFLTFCLRAILNIIPSMATYAIIYSYRLCIIWEGDNLSKVHGFVSWKLTLHAGWSYKWSLLLIGLPRNSALHLKRPYIHGPYKRGALIIYMTCGDKNIISVSVSSPARGKSARRAGRRRSSWRRWMWSWWRGRRACSCARSPTDPATWRAWRGCGSASGSAPLRRAATTAIESKWNVFQGPSVVQEFACHQFGIELKSYHAQKAKMTKW